MSVHVWLIPRRKQPIPPCIPTRAAATVSWGAGLVSRFVLNPGRTRVVLSVSCCNGLQAAWSDIYGLALLGSLSKFRWKILFFSAVSSKPKQISLMTFLNLMEVPQNKVVSFFFMKVWHVTSCNISQKQKNPYNDDKNYDIPLMS